VRIDHIAIVHPAEEVEEEAVHILPTTVAVEEGEQLRQLQLLGYPVRLLLLVYLLSP